MTARPDSPTHGRWEVGILVGPCTQEEVERLVDVLATLPALRALGGAVAATRVDDEEEGL